MTSYQARTNVEAVGARDRSLDCGMDDAIKVISCWASLVNLAQELRALASNVDDLDLERHPLVCGGESDKKAGKELAQGVSQDVLKLGIGADANKLQVRKEHSKGLFSQEGQSTV